MVKTFVCPSYPFEAKDSLGYGYVHYGATVYTDINQATGLRDEVNSRQHGARTSIADGTANTILIAEDGARWGNYVTNRSYTDPATTAGVADDNTSFGTRLVQAVGRTGQRVRRIRRPPRLRKGDGDSTNCPWNRSDSNCGPNDEIFSFHPRGATVVFADGQITFVRDAESETGCRTNLSTSKSTIAGATRTPARSATPGI